MTQRLNEKCIKKGSEVGFCTFGKFRLDFKNLAYVGFVILFLYLLMGEAQPAFLLVSVPRTTFFGDL